MADQVHTATAVATDGSVRTEDGRVDVGLAVAGDTAADGATTPEHLMAAALASCLEQALAVAASTQGATAVGASVQASVTLASGEGAGYTAAFELEVSGLGEGGDAVLEQALQLCPFTKALDGRGLTVRTA